MLLLVIIVGLEPVGESIESNLVEDALAHPLGNNSPIKNQADRLGLGLAWALVGPSP